MAKGEGFSLVSTDEQPRPSTVQQIFQEAAKLLWRSRKPMLAILLILFHPHALLIFGMSYLITPLTTEMTMESISLLSKDPRTLEYHELLVAALKDARELTVAEVAIMLVSFLYSAFFMAAVQMVDAMASKGEEATLKCRLCRIGRAWKGPVATQLIGVFLIDIGYAALLLLMIGAFAIFSTGSVAALALGGVLVILALLVFLYLRMVWVQGLVISVVEEGCSGLAALGRASELIRGRMRLGFNVGFFLLLCSSIIPVVSYLGNTRVTPAGGRIHLIGWLDAIHYWLLVSSFVLTVHVVFYLECKIKSRGDREVAVKESLLYTRLPNIAPTVDGALP